MAFWNKKRDAAPYTFDPATGNVIPIPDGQKAVTLTEFAQTEIIINYSGVPFPGDHGLMYRRQPAVRTVVDWLAHTVASVSLKTYIRRDNTDREELDGHPLSRLLRAPNPETTEYRLFRDLVADIAIEDVGYWGKIRQTPASAPYALVRIPSSKLSRDLIDGQVIYRNATNGKPIARRDLVIFPGYSPDGLPWGVSPMETLRHILEEDWEAIKNRKGYWRNNARQGGVIRRSLEAPPWSDEERQRFRTGWQGAMAGAENAGKWALLEDGMEDSPNAFSAESAQYIEGRRLTFEEVCREYRLSPTLFGVGGEGVTTDRRKVYEDTLGSWFKSIEDEIELQLLPEFEASTPAAASSSRVYVEFNIAAKTAASFEDLAKTLTTSTGVPITTVNESRAKLNLPKIDGDEWDIPIQPLNVMYGGQPSPQIPTATPASPPAAGDTFGTRTALRSRRKAVPAGPIRRRNQAADRYQTELVNYFDRLQRGYRSARKTKAGFEWGRWDRKLSLTLFGTSQEVAATTGQRAAKQMSGVYNEDQTIAFLHANSTRTAKAINEQTAADLAEAEDDDAVDHVFDIAKGSRAPMLALGLATSIVGFARSEAAKQSTFEDGRTRTKTWVVTSTNSRHPELDGETVNFDETFSNGCLWPGDSAGGADETAGCSCLLDIG